jgi:hypothetical protein
MFDHLVRLVFQRLLTVRPLLEEIKEQQIEVRRMPIGAGMPQEFNRAFAGLMWSVERLGMLLNEEVPMEDTEVMTNPIVTGYIVQFTPEDSESHSTQFAGPFLSQEDAKDWIENNHFGEGCDYYGTTQIIEISTDPSEIDVR